MLDRRGLERAGEQAEILRVFALRQVEDVLARAHGRRGAGTLAAVLDELRPGGTLTRQDLEERFLALRRQAALPRPEVNAGSHTARPAPKPTSCGARKRLAVELDGRDVHMTPRPSSAIACAISTCRCRAGASCASPDASSPTTRDGRRGDGPRAARGALRRPPDGAAQLSLSTA